MDEDRSSSWPLFRQSAEDLAAKLGAIATTDAVGMAREARDLCATFLGWETLRPTNEARVTAIQHLFDLNRRAMDFMMKRQSSSNLAASKGPQSSPPKR